MLQDQSCKQPKKEYSNNLKVTAYISMQSTDIHAIVWQKMRFTQLL